MFSKEFSIQNASGSQSKVNVWSNGKLYGSGKVQYFKVSIDGGNSQDMQWSHETGHWTRTGCGWVIVERIQVKLQALGVLTSAVATETAVEEAATEEEEIIIISIYTCEDCGGLISNHHIIPLCESCREKLTSATSYPSVIVGGRKNSCIVVEGNPFSVMQYQMF